MDSILVIEHASFGKDAYDRNLFAGFYHKCGDLFLVAEGAGRICGYLIACIRSREGTLRAQLVSLAVAPEARRQGVASLLLKAAVRRLRRRGAVRFTLMVKVTNIGAQSFYEWHGFSPIRIARRYYEDGKDAWLMARDLA